jgi:hypothetical protein
VRWPVAAHLAKEDLQDWPVRFYRHAVAPSDLGPGAFSSVPFAAHASEDSQGLSALASTRLLDTAAPFTGTEDYGIALRMVCSLPHLLSKREVRSLPHS